MREIRAKVGTKKMSCIFVGWKRKPPSIGDVIKFRSAPLQHGEKWKRGLVDDIKDVGFQLYYISL